MIFIYKKADQKDLTTEQINTLKQLIEENMS